MATASPRGDQIFDTSFGLLDGVPVSSWDPVSLAWNVTGLDIPTGASLTVVGDNPFVVAVDGDVTIAGLLDVSGEDGGAAAVGSSPLSRRAT